MVDIFPIGAGATRYFGNLDVPDGGYVGNVDGIPIIIFDYTNDALQLNGTNIIGVGYLDFQTDQIAPAHQEGRIFYDDDNKTLAVYNNESDVTLQLGQEMYIRATNKTGVTITNGQLVYVNGAQGSRPTIALARSDSPATCGVIAMATHDILNNRTGFVTTFGLVHDVDTSLAAAGTDLYLSDSVAGDYTDTMPVAPNFPIHIGTILFSNASSGIIAIHIGPTDVCRTMVIEDLDINTDLRIGGDLFTDSIKENTSGGGIIIQPLADSTTFFQVKDAAGNIVGNFDTTNRRLGIGLANPSTILELAADNPVMTFNDTAGGSPLDFQIGSTVAGQFNFYDMTNDRNVFSYIAGARLVISTDTGAVPFLISRIIEDTTQVLKIFVDDRHAHIQSIQDEADSGGIKFRTDSDADNVNSGFFFNNKNDVTLVKIIADGTILQQGPTPYYTFLNDTHEDSDGGRESRLNFKGEQSGEEETTLARIEVGHDGAADDEKGYWDLFVNDGSDGDSPTKRMRVESLGNWIISKTSGIGVKVDLTTPTFGFADLLGEPAVKNTGASKPSLVAYRDGLLQFEFAAGEEEYFDYHIPHDYVKGTDIFLHFHWSTNGALVTGGTVTFDYEISYAKAHAQAPFPASVSGTVVSATASSTQYTQELTEVQISASTPSGSQIDTDDLEPDGVIICTAGLNANNLTVSGGAVPDPFIHYIDIHYQTTGIIGTKAKAPDFYA